MSEKPRIGISCGDLNGVGMELVLRVLSDPRILHSMTPIVYAPQRAVSLYRKILG
ncbi:MAG: 4-hydroxythreonine-4-phosphate dehydrogenase PdxA, partial [Bacteroidetes bacterium]|nr:4-hydroxythreonine-4-phosphate dehydrogenase PdxA [Bacteroidota bacterium]